MKKGFTLAEILITMSIIGIVAAIMVPSLLVSVNERAYDAQRRAFHARMAQAIGQLDVTSYEAATGNTDDGSTIKFLTQGLNRVYKVSSICDKDNLGACDIPETVRTASGGQFDLRSKATFNAFNSRMRLTADTAQGFPAVMTLDTYPAGFRTTNGESVMVFYNPRCNDNSNLDFTVAISEACINFVYDLNGGSKTPNEVGKDVGFITVIGATSTTVAAPKVYSGKYFTSKDYDGAVKSCKDAQSNLALPDREQLISIMVNARLIDAAIGNEGQYWSSTTSVKDDGTDAAWTVGPYGNQSLKALTESVNAVCIYR